jgi:hypothetical protein
MVMSVETWRATSVRPMPMTINVESLPSGIYFLQIECRDAINRVRTAKFVKE